MCRSSLKIKTLDEVDSILDSARQNGRKIVHCHGVFDLLHPGHIQYFQSAKKSGDLLVVTLVRDQDVHLGPGRPVFNERLRSESLAELDSIDFVAICETPSLTETIKRIKAHVFVKGSTIDDDGKIDTEKQIEEAVQTVGGKVETTGGITFSSTHLINNYFAVFSEQARTFLDSFQNKYSADKIIDHLNGYKDLRVLIVGDAIIDEYHYTEALGKPTKSACISAQFLREEHFAGGALSIANHVAGFCKDVHLVTCLGQQDSRADFIAQKLKPNVSSKFFYRSDAPTVVKRRFVHAFQLTKMFEVCYLQDKNLDEETEQQVCSYLGNVVNDYDLVIVADFGHGFVGPYIADTLCEKARFLSVNAQANSANLGFNVVTKFPRADYICIDEREIRLAQHSKHGPIRELTRDIAERLKSRNVSVTLGGEGALVYEAGNGFTQVPVFSSSIIDTVGAGDAFLSITSLCATRKEHVDFIGFVGNAVGALAVRIVGNKESVEPESLFTFIHTLLK